MRPSIACLIAHEPKCEHCIRHVNIQCFSKEVEYCILYDIHLNALL